MALARCGTTDSDRCATPGALEDRNRGAISQNEALLLHLERSRKCNLLPRRGGRAKKKHNRRKPTDRSKRGELGCPNTMEGEKGDRLDVASFVIRNGQRKRHRESRHVWAGKGGRARLRHVACSPHTGRFYVILASGIPETSVKIPRLHKIRVEFFIHLPDWAFSRNVTRFQRRQKAGVCLSAVFLPIPRCQK